MERLAKNAFSVCKNAENEHQKKPMKQMNGDISKRYLSTTKSSKIKALLVFQIENPPGLD
jgi:hypothetical protein